MTRWWDSSEQTPRQNGRRRDPTQVRELSDCKQADVIDVGGEALRIAWFYTYTHRAAAYPTGDVGPAMDGSNLRYLSPNTPVKPISLVS